MGEATSDTVIIMSTVAIAVVHALAPDHWVPFVGIGRARRWSAQKLVGVTLVAGLGHVGSSILIGCLGMILGFGLAGLESVEAQRGEVAGLLLVGFGLAYAIWGLKRMRSNVPRQSDPGRSVALWTLIAVFVLGPCEPLIPLIFVAATRSWHLVTVVSALFGVITLVMMVAQVLVVHLGLDRFPLAHRLGHDHGHILAGLVIAATGASVMMLGI